MTDASQLPSRSQHPVGLDAAGSTRADDRPQKSSWLGKLLALVGAIVAAVYLANPGWGVAEILPDNIPGAGNLDEFIFSVVLIACLRKLGIDILPLMRGGLPRGVKKETELKVKSRNSNDE